MKTLNIIFRLTILSFLIAFLSAIALKFTPAIKPLVITLSISTASLIILYILVWAFNQK